MKRILPFLFLFAFAANADEVNSVSLQWDPNSEPDIAGYRVYWKTNGASSWQSGAQTSKTNVTLSTGFANGGTYKFVVTAFNTAGLESGPSNEVSFTFGVPPASPRGVFGAVSQTVTTIFHTVTNWIVVP